MRPGVAANFVSELQSFQQPTLACLEGQPSGTFSGVSKDGRICWIARGSLVEVLDVSSRDRLAVWQFGRVLGDQHTSITCIEEFSVGQSLKLVVGVCNSSPTGLLCVFDVALSKVVKAIDIPHPVTELEVVCTRVRENVPNWALSEHLRYFCGLVAVGTAGGHVYLVDMCLDDTEFFSDEEVASKVHFIWPRNRDVENQRFHCMSQGLHLCMTLNESLFTRNGFEYQKPDGLVIKTFREDNVSVTSLKYVPQAGILVVGYSFGCFQLWKLHVPVLEYSSRLESEPQPVTHIAYQEPENDPKNFCYLWVARGQLVTEENQELDSVSTICLYQLSFSNKSFYSKYGVFYDDLTSVCLRMEHELTANPVQFGSNFDGGSRVVACCTLIDPHYRPPTRLGEDESFEESNHGPDLSLCMFVWEATEGSVSSKVGRHLAIFDINRWYHAQMPASVRYVSGSVDTCSYLCFCKLDDIADAASADNMLAVHVTADRLRKFVSNLPMPSEQHFYPASLAFDVKMVFESGIITAQFLGSQRQVLSNLETRGPAGLIQPQDLYNICIHVGLLPRTAETMATLPNLVYQREALLSLALEYNLLCFIKACVTQWAIGEYEHQGCSLKFLLDWAWEKVSTTKHQIDTACVNLYNWSGLIMDQRSLQTLLQSNQKLDHLISLFKTFTSQTGPVTQQGETELQSKILVTSLISQHLSVVLWFVAAGLLPEHDDTEDVMGTQYCYPATSLVLAYKNRRAELQTIHSEIGETDVLMIDGLVDDLRVHDLWDLEGGSGMYPPPSLHALLSTYLLQDVDMLSKHCLVLYLLLDLVSVDTSDETFCEKVSRFAHRFNLPPTVVKLIQAFWLLDHRDFEEAMVLLLDPMVTAEFSRWQHKRIIKALLYQGDAKLAQRYITSVKPALTTPEEVKLRLTVLLANGSTAAALEYQRQCRDEHNMQDLLSHVILGCQQTKTVDRLLQLPLTLQEEAILIDYLLESSEPQLQELLVMHYLQRSRFVEAIQLNEKLKHSVLIESNAKARERAASRNAIVDKYATILPSVQRKLLFEQVHMPKKNTQWRREVRRPTPLSTKITKTKATVMSQSAFIMTIMEKLDEIDTGEPASSDAANKSVGPFICTPVTPARKSLRDTPITAYPESTDKYKASRGNLSLHKALQMFQTADSTPGADKRQSRYFSASCLSLLQTPTVQKLTPKKQRLSSSNVITPQSILKVKHMISTTSPSPRSGTATPNSQELDGSVKKIPRKLGYGASLSQPGTPRSVSFSDPPLSSVPRHLAGELVQTSSQPASPKSVSFAEPSSARPDRQSQPSTPKSVSFADSRITTAAKLKPLTTPKQSRFINKPGSSTSGSRWSPSGSPTLPDSPKSLRDRSPTPESSQNSPRLASNVDVLHRRPLRTTPPEDEDLYLRLEESDDSLSDDDVEEMENSSISGAAFPPGNVSITSSATMISPGEQDMSLSPQKINEDLSSPLTPQKSPTAKQPSSPTVKISKSPISIYSSENRTSVEQDQSISMQTEHVQTVSADKQSIDSEPVNIDLTVSEDEEMGDEDMPILERESEIVPIVTSSLPSKEIFEADEEISPPGEVEEMEEAEIVSSSSGDDEVVLQEVEAVTQSIKQEVHEIEEEFDVPPKPVRELEPPSPPKVEEKTPSPLRRKSITPPHQRQIKLIKPKHSPPNTDYGIQSTSANTSFSPVKKSSPQFLDNILNEIDTKFGDSPTLNEQEVKSSIKLGSGSVIMSQSRTTRTRRKYEISPVKIEVVTQPVTSTRSTRRQSKELSVPPEEPATPTRSSRRHHKEEDVVQQEAPMTPIRSSRRHQKRSESEQNQVEITVESPLKFSQEAKEAVQASLQTVSMELRAKSGTSPELMTRIKDSGLQEEPVTPTRSSRHHHKEEEVVQQEASVTPTRSSRRHQQRSESEQNQVEITVESPLKFSQEAKEAVQASLHNVSMELRTKAGASPELMTRIKDHNSPTRTPTRSSRRHKDEKNLEETYSDENVKITPSRSSRRKKTEIDVSSPLAGTSEVVATPRRGRRKEIMPEKQRKSPARNKNQNQNDSSPSRRSISPSVNSADISSGVENIQNILTPTRGGRRKKGETLSENKDNETEATAVTPSRKSKQLLKEDVENIELTPSRRQSFGRSEIPIDLIETENLENTPSRRQSLSRSCKEIVDDTEQISTPTRRRSLGRSVKNTEVATPVKVAVPDTDDPVTPSRTPGRRGRPRKTNKPSPAIEQVLTPSQQSRSNRVKSEPDTSDTDMVADKTESTKKESSDISQTRVLTPSRRGRPKKVKVDSETVEASSDEGTKKATSPKTTPSRRKRIKKEEKEDTSPARGTRSHDGDKVVETPLAAAVLPEVYDIHSTSFQFSDPMQIDGSEETVVTAKSFTPIKSFIFSPPIHNPRHSLKHTMELEEEGILLPPGPSVAQVKEKKQRTSKTTTRTKKLYKEEILLISPMAASQGDHDDGEEGRNIVNRTTQGGAKKVKTKMDGSKLLVESLRGRGRRTRFGQTTTRTSHRFGALGKKD